MSWEEGKLYDIDADADVVQFHGIVDGLILYSFYIVIRVGS